MEIHKCDQCGKDITARQPIEIYFKIFTLGERNRVEFCSNDCAIKYLNERRIKNESN